MELSRSNQEVQIWSFCTSRRSSPGSVKRRFLHLRMWFVGGAFLWRSAGLRAGRYKRGAVPQTQARSTRLPHAPPLDQTDQDGPKKCKTVVSAPPGHSGGQKVQIVPFYTSRIPEASRSADRAVLHLPHSGGLKKCRFGHSAPPGHSGGLKRCRSCRSAPPDCDEPSKKCNSPVPNQAVSAHLFRIFVESI